MITKIKTAKNPFGDDWLEKLRRVLPTIDGLKISDNRLLIDGNRKALFITGHKTSFSKAYIGITKIYLEDAILKIKTTALTPHIFIGIIFPLAVIVYSWTLNKSTTFTVIMTAMFMIGPIYYIRDILKQEKFSDEVQNEIDRLNE